MPRIACFTSGLSTPPAFCLPADGLDAVRLEVLGQLALAPGDRLVLAIAITLSSAAMEFGPPLGGQGVH
jgi:hypothetical protein